jgi:hypothetical protein
MHKIENIQILKLHLDKTKALGIINTPLLTTKKNELELNDPLSTFSNQLRPLGGTLDYPQDKKTNSESKNLSLKKNSVRNEVENNLVTN